MNVLFATIAAVGVLTMPATALAQAYPVKPIRLIVPFAAGNTPDIAARSMGGELVKQVGQQIVVDNRPGASGIIGYELLARSVPDGYTFGYISNTIATNPYLYSKVPYDARRDFQPIILPASGANMLTITPSLPAKSLKELIALARAKPGALAYGSPANGASAHLAMELLKMTTGTDFYLVLYKTSQQTVTDTISGQIQVLCDTITVMLPQVKAGRLRGLAVTSAKRSPAAPEFPTFDEAGIKGFEFTNWGGYAFPAGVPREMVQRLNGEMNKILQTPAFTAGLLARGAVPVGGTPEQFADHIRTQTELSAKVIKAAGIKPIT